MDRSTRLQRLLSVTWFLLLFSGAYVGFVSVLLLGWLTLRLLSV